MKILALETTERIGTIAEHRRDVAGVDGTALGMHLIPELAIEQKVLEHVELLLTVIELRAELIERRQQR